MLTRCHFTCLVLLAACGSSKDAPAPASGGSAAEIAPPIALPKPKKPAPPTGTPRPQPKLTATLDGKPLAIVAAHVWKGKDGDLKWELSSVPVSCEEATSDMRAYHDGEVMVSLHSGFGLQPDGTLAGQLQSVSFSGMNTSGVTATAITGDGTPGQSTTATLDFEIADLATPPKKLVVKGTVDAEGCAPPPPSKYDTPAKPLPPEQPATLEIAGKQLPIRGALLHPGHWTDLELTTGAETCDDSFGGSPLSARISFDGKEVKQIQLSGSLINGGNGPIDQTFDRKKLAVAPLPLAAGETTVKADIMVVKYPVKLAGKVTVVACPK